MKDLVIVGAGGHGREVLQLVRDINAASPCWNVLGFVDDAASAPGRLAETDVLGRIDALAGRACHVVIAIGSPAVRRKVARRLLDMGVSSFATLVHPGAVIGERVRIGEGSIVCAGSVLTTDITLGQHVIVNTASVVSHDCVLEDFVTLAPRVTLCGAVRIAEGVELGAAASVVPGMQLAAWCRVGAGACVISPVHANETVVGVPARCVRVRDAQWQDQR